MQSRDITRRAALGRLSAGSLLALGLWPGVLRAGDSNNSGNFRFVVLNDLHYLSPECGRWLEKVTRQIKTHEGVELCLVAGDLAEYGRPEDFAAVRDIFGALGMPLYVVVGNHDYLAEKLPSPPSVGPSTQALAPKDERNQPPANAGQNDRRAYDQFFPRRVNYYFEHRGWQFVGLDTTQGLAYDKTQIQPATLQWVDDHLPRLSTTLPTVLFTHFPLGANVRYRPANADELLARFQACNLQAVFCGHWHGFSERRLGRATLATNRCCALKRGNHDGTKEKGYFLCAAAQGQITREFCRVEE